MGLIVSQICPLLRLLIRGCLTFEKSSIVFISHVVSWALDLSELVKFFVIVILNFLLLIIFFLCKIESFFFELTLYYFLRAFRFHLCLAFFLIDFVIGGLDLDIVLHTFLQQTFVIKSLEHLDQWSNIILVHNIFLNVGRLYVLWDLCLPLFLDWQGPRVPHFLFQRILFGFLWQQGTCRTYRAVRLNFRSLIFGFVFMSRRIMVS